MRLPLSILLMIALFGCKTSDDTKDLSGLWKENTEFQVPGRNPDYLWLEETGSGSLFSADTLCYVVKTASWNNDAVFLDDTQWKVKFMNDSSMTLTFNDTLPDTVIGYYIDITFERTALDTNSLVRCVE